MCTKEIYNCFGFGLDPVTTIAMQTIYVSLFGFLDVACGRLDPLTDFKPVALTICQIYIRFGESVYPKKSMPL